MSTIRVTAAILGGAVAATAAVTASSPAAAPGGALRITAKPSLRPAFDPAGTDYVSRCGTSGLTLSIDAPPGETVSVDGGPARTGSFGASVPLRSGQGLVVKATSAGGTAAYHVRCLPRGFPAWSAERSGPTQAQWYLLSPKAPWVIFFDARGAPVWWTHTKVEAFNPTPLRDGNLAWYPLPPDTKFGVFPGTTYEEHRLDGKQVRKLGTVGVPTDGHELQELPNGHFLLDAYPPRYGVDLRAYGGPRKAKVYYAQVQEITTGGRLVWKWDSRGRIGLSEAKRWWPDGIRVQGKLPPGRRFYDAAHINSISPDPGGLVISTRHTDAVYRIDRATGRVDWKLGGTHTKRSLRIVGDPTYGTTSFGGQHDARVLPDGTITVYDNGSGRDRPPRVLRYRIDTAKRTATALEQLTDPDARRSLSQGSTRKLPGGDWVTSWASEPYVTEMAPSGERVFRLTFPGTAAYRVFPIPFGAFSAARLRAAMDRMHPRG